MALITNSTWGSVTVDYVTFRDVVVTPTGCKEWNWAHIHNDIMHHDPGIRIQDIDSLILPSNPDIVILSRGRRLALQVPPHIERYLLSNSVKEVYVLETSQAISKYNEFIQKGARVAALIHTTC